MIPVIYTAILDQHDNLRTPSATEPGAQYVCFSDDPWQEPCPPWELRPAHRLCDHPSRDSRIPKILPHLFFDAKVSIWTDGCFRQVAPLSSVPRSSGGPLLAYLDDVDLVAFEHPRKNAFDEAAFCRLEAGTHGFTDQTLRGIDWQLARYAAAGYGGLPFACGGIILRRHSPAVEAFNELWMREYLAGEMRDQFSLSYALWRSGIRYRLIEGIDILQNPWFGFSFHAGFAGTGNDTFNGVRRQKAEKQARLAELLQPAEALAT